MRFERFEDGQLSQVSYLVGCTATGQALIVDPTRDVDRYLRAAERAELTITHVTETHIHADFVSGARELAERTGARLLLSDEGGDDWRYAYAAEYDSVLLTDGATFRVGTVEVRALHTPGHTPEHLTFLVTDTQTADQPMGAFTGDFLFVGDVGRPDLLEKAAKVAGTMESSARTLFGSVQRFKREVPEFVQIWPGHVAGSVCGKDLSAVPHSSLGYEKLFNWSLATDDEEEFVRLVLAGQPDPPKYFAEMKRINREGPPVLGGFTMPRRLSARQLAGAMEAGSLVIDTRRAADFGAAHVPGTINIPLTRSFTTWAGWLTPYDSDFYLILEDRCSHCLDEAVKSLRTIGLDRIAGYWGGDVVDAWRAEQRPLETVPTIHAASLADDLRKGTVEILDVRELGEWEAGHIPAEDASGEPLVRHIPLGSLPERLSELPRDRKVAVHCQGGGRSAIAASLLQAHGFENVVNFSGGFGEWTSRGLAVQKEPADGEPA